MGWQRYDLVFRLLAPLHSGWRKSGNLQQTRGYVPGKNVWAALTARLTRETGQGAVGSAYEEMGKLVQCKFRFTYLYPATQNGNGYTTHYPWDDGFDYLFLDSYTSTALNYPSQSAEEGLLHETEFIAPRTRDGDPVYLTGCLYAQAELPAALQKWQDALTKLQFGGERGYGWGRVALVECAQRERIEGNEVQIQVAAGHQITAHLEAKEAIPGVSGPLEPFIGWERNNPKEPTQKQPSWKLSDIAIICYAPGATIITASAFVVGKFGVLSPASD